MDTITPAEVKKRLEQGEKLDIIDVREEEEVAQGMIPGAIHIPLMQVPERLSEIPQRGETILVCRSGNRSGRAYDYLTAQGLTRLKSMSGGMMDWEKL
jgi:rhodanese-related sulfurtransferase